MARRFVIMGPQGSGKGTQADLLCAKFGLPHVDTGELLREEIRGRTEIGKRIEQIYNTGQLLSNDIVLAVLKKRFSEIDLGKGFVWEGYPRNEEQFHAMPRLPSVDKVIFIDVPKKVLLERLSGRRNCPKCNTIYHLKFMPPKKDEICDKDGAKLIHRPDDKPDAIKKRLEIFEKDTIPLVHKFHLAGIMIKIDGMGAPEEVFKRVLKAIGEK